MNPEIIKPYEPGYQNLKAVAAMLQATSKNDLKYTVEDVYFDYKMNWFWTTICREDWGGCQVINPRQWEEILTAKNEDDLFKCIKEIKNGKYFDD